MVVTISTLFFEAQNVFLKVFHFHSTSKPEFSVGLWISLLVVVSVGVVVDVVVVVVSVDVVVVVVVEDIVVVVVVVDIVVVVAVDIGIVVVVFSSTFKESIVVVSSV